MFYDNEVFNEMCQEHEVSEQDATTLLSLFDDEAADALPHLADGESDFCTDNWRVIKESWIDSVLADELKDSPYLLGSFAPWALADVLGLSTDFVAQIQAAGLGEQLGEELTSNHVEQLAEILISHDGYGHHFATYDGHEHSFMFDGDAYYAFRI
jgi:hypothetical protein